MFNCHPLFTLNDRIFIISSIGIRELSNLVNLDLMKLVRKCEKESRKPGASQSYPAITYDKVTLKIDESNPLVPTEPPFNVLKDKDLKLQSLVEVLMSQLQRGRVETKLAVLRWIYHLFTISRPKVSIILKSLIKRFNISNLDTF